MYDLSIKQVHNTLCKNFFESGGHNTKYIPLIKPDTSHSCVPSPFSWTMASVFEPNDKEKKKAFCRRLAGEEKYKLGPVGQRPVIKPKLITGNLSGWRFLYIPFCLCWFYIDLWQVLYVYLNLCTLKVNANDPIKTQVSKQMNKYNLKNIFMEFGIILFLLLSDFRWWGKQELNLFTNWLTIHIISSQHSHFCCFSILIVLACT